MKISRRTATQADENFISGLILSGARKKHFAIDTNDSQAVKTMKQHVHFALQHGNLSTGLQCMTNLYSVNDQKAGFIMLIDMPESENSVEIYALAVSPFFQRHGIGSIMLEQAIDPLYRFDVYARCAPESLAMRKMLHSRGFQSIDKSLTGDELFKREAPADNWASPAFFSSFEPTMTQK